MNFDSIIKNANLNRLSKSASTFAANYRFWINYLFERTMLLFKWENLSKDPDVFGLSLSQKEIEIPLMANGMCAVYSGKETKGEPLPFFADFSGEPTLFYDTKKSLSISSPIFSGVFEIGTEVALIGNTSTYTSLYPLINRYAILLAHMEVSLINTLINGRDSGGIPVASTESQRQSIMAYRDSLCTGKVGVIMDPAFLGVDFKGISKNTTLSVLELVEAMDNTLEGFYNAIGVRTTWKKKGNMIQEEIQANDSMVLLNISDMLESRKRGCEMVNNLFGTNWTVEKVSILEYKEDGENEQTNDLERNL